MDRSVIHGGNHAGQTGHVRLCPAVSGSRTKRTAPFRGVRNVRATPKAQRFLAEHGRGRRDASGALGRAEFKAAPLQSECFRLEQIPNAAAGAVRPRSRAVSRPRLPPVPVRSGAGNDGWMLMAGGMPGVRHRASPWRRRHGCRSGMEGVGQGRRRFPSEPPAPLVGFLWAGRAHRRPSHCMMSGHPSGVGSRSSIHSVIRNSSSTTTSNTNFLTAQCPIWLVS